MDDFFPQDHIGMSFSDMEEHENDLWVQILPWLQVVFFVPLNWDICLDVKRNKK